MPFFSPCSCGNFSCSCVYQCSLIIVHQKSVGLYLNIFTIYRHTDFTNTQTLYYVYYVIKMYITVTLRFFMSVKRGLSHWGCTSHWYQVVLSTSGSSICTLLQVTRLVSRIIRRTVDFWKIFAPLDGGVRE